MICINVCIVHQIDLGGAVTGGIDSVIRGIAKSAPADIEVRVVGLTTAPAQRPVGQWTEVQLGRRRIKFLPVGVAGTAMLRKGIPLSVRMAWGVLRYRSQILAQCDVLEFHRLEAGLPLWGAWQGKNTVVHQNIAALTNKNSVIGWRHFPSLYFALESRFLHAMDNVFCVRSDATEAYRQRFLCIADRF